MNPEVRAQKGIRHWGSVQIARISTRMTELMFGIAADGHPLEVAIESSARLLRLARQQVRIVSDSLNPQFYTSPPLLGALREIVEWRRVKLSIVHGTGADPRSIRTLLGLDGHVTLYQYPGNTNPDLMVIDNRHIRIETPSGVFSVRNIPDAAARLEERFERFLQTE